MAPRSATRAIPILAVLVVLTTAPAVAGPTDRPDSTATILVTSAAGARQARVANLPLEAGPAPRDGRVVVSVAPDRPRQVIDGIGTSFTESSAFVLAHLDPARRAEVVARLFGAEGADFTLARTHLGSCDFSVEGRYSYAERPDDRQLASFSIAPDSAGFDPSRYPGVRDPAYDLLPFVREALALKRGRPDSPLRIVASAWTAPPWMKDIGTWYIPGSAANGWQGSGGWLKDEHFATYADYLVKALEAWDAAGVRFWALTPVNEPHGNGGHWESMHFTPGSQNVFIRRDLGPRLWASRVPNTRLLVYDQNRDGLEPWLDAILGDRDTAPYVYGAAIHWYGSTVKVFDDVLEMAHRRYPDFAIVHTEGCIDALGTPAPGGITDPDGFTEEPLWFGNDAWWWEAHATDWAYTATWAGPGAADHPKYVPVHRYARNIIVSLDHWVTGWIDWNAVLDRRGGPNHVDNFCGAPVMIDTDTGEIHYTPVYHVLAQFSRTIRPGDRAVTVTRDLAGRDADALHACATMNADGLVSVQLLNTTGAALAIGLEIGDRHLDLTVPANAVQTVRVAGTTSP
ncbi:glycoside hydrolase family 30 protein [bacterium]|nr:glycoside hydrolase family 30 protein [bacterium]